MKVAVLGAGSWGTALGLVLSRNKHAVKLWTHRAEQAAELSKRRINERYLPGIALPGDWEICTDIQSAVRDADLSRRRSATDTTRKSKE